MISRTAGRKVLGVPFPLIDAHGVKSQPEPQAGVNSASGPDFEGSPRWIRIPTDRRAPSARALPRCPAGQASQTPGARRPDPTPA